MCPDCGNKLTYYQETDVENRKYIQELWICSECGMKWTEEDLNAIETDS